MTTKNVIAPKPTRRRRAAVFQAYVLFSVAGFIGLAVAARAMPYFPIDLTITRAVQSVHNPVFDGVMFGVSWIGFWPQSLVTGLALCGVIFAFGLRWEAVMMFFAECSSFVAEGMKLVVSRPRPTDDLVDVIRELTTSSFPSGHVLTGTAMCGFLAFLSYTLLKQSWQRSAFLAFFTLIAILMGLSRIHQGQHWFSDVIGGYLLGSLWLLLTIRIYRWGKSRYFVRQPVAPETSATTR